MKERDYTEEKESYEELAKGEITPGQFKRIERVEKDELEMWYELFSDMSSWPW